MIFRTLIVALSLTGVALAQHGGGHGGGMGMGHSGTGMPSMGSHSSSSSTMSGPHSPAELLSQNSRLSSNLDKLLPNGMTAQQACSGYKNLGQCVAAIHVSHNLGIPFGDLKARTTGSGSESLGKAIESLCPDANAKDETKKANQQAKRDIEDNSYGIFGNSGTF